MNFLMNEFSFTECDYRRFFNGVQQYLKRLFMLFEILLTNKTHYFLRIIFV